MANMESLNVKYNLDNNIANIHKQTHPYNVITQNLYRYCDVSMHIIENKSNIDIYIMVHIMVRKYMILISG